MDVYYVNSKNQRVYFTQIPYVLLDGGTIFDYSLSYTTTAGKEKPRIKNFSNNLKKGDMTIIVSGKTREEYCENINNLMDVIAYDVNNNTPGKLYCGEQYCSGYFFENKHGTTYNNSRRAELKLNFITENGKWIKETTTTFGYDYGTEGNNLDFKNDFPMDYTSNLIGKTLNNTGFMDTNFRMVIYGACENPEVVINGHSYNVNVKIEANEYLTIDSIEKTIVLTHVDGSTENCFNKRNRESYVFEKIPSGVSGVSSGHFKFDVTLLEERSEPKWT